jgi:hypothetical protein
MIEEPSEDFPSIVVAPLLIAEYSGRQGKNHEAQAKPTLQRPRPQRRPR